MSFGRVRALTLGELFQLAAEAMPEGHASGMEPSRGYFTLEGGRVRRIEDVPVTSDHRLGDVQRRLGHIQEVTFTDY